MNVQSILGNKGFDVATVDQHASLADACAQLRAQGVKPEEIERIDLKVHSLVLELTGKKEPADGLQGKFSVYHGCACGLMFGKAGEDQYADDIVNRPDMVALRRKVVAVVDDNIDESSVDATAVPKDGRKVHVFVKHAIGSLENPMTDAEVERKFRTMVEPRYGKERVKTMLAALWDMDKAGHAESLLRLFEEAGE